MLRTVISLVLALGVSAAVADGDLNITTDNSGKIESNDAGSLNDDMKTFLTAVNNLPELTNSNPESQAGKRHRRHLGLGFTHGMANINRHKNSRAPATTVSNPPFGEFVFGNGNTSLHHDVCRGNGHSDAINGAGTKSRSGNRFAYTDCGDPSPSD